MKNVILKPAPPGGEGNHSWLYYAAVRLTEAGYTDAEAAPIMESGMNRPPQTTEIQDALCAARREDKPVIRRWPKRNLKKIIELRETPVPELSPLDITAEEAIAALFPPSDTLLCVGLTSSIFCTKKRSQWANKLRGNSLIVPSPMSDVWGLTKGGKRSMHTLDNTGERRYLVCEFDWGTRETQLQLGRYLSSLAHLVCVVFSGGKSHHFWFECEPNSEEKALEFFAHAVSLGADPRTWLKSQFVRMPGGRRDIETPQPILYFNPPKL